jgi:hypothetical protein
MLGATLATERQKLVDDCEFGIAEFQKDLSIVSKYLGS